MSAVYRTNVDVKTVITSLRSRTGLFSGTRLIPRRRGPGTWLVSVLVFLLAGLAPRLRFCFPLVSPSWPWSAPEKEDAKNFFLKRKTKDPRKMTFNNRYWIIVYLLCRDLDLLLSRLRLLLLSLGERDRDRDFEGERRPLRPPREPDLDLVGGIRLS